MPDPGRRDIAVQQARAKRVMQKFFTGQAKSLAQQISAKYQAALGKAAGDSNDGDESETPQTFDPLTAANIADSLAGAAALELETLPDEIFDPLARAYKSGRTQALITVGEVVDGRTADAARQAINFDVVNEGAVDYAEARAAELVGMRRVDGELVENPDARYTITNGTRDAIRSLVKDALLQGWSGEQLATQIQDDAAFGYERAFKVARTEMRFANSAGTLDAWHTSGRIETKEWSTAQDDKVEEVCEANAAVGAIPLADDFPSGDPAPPAHPECRCVILGNPYANDEED